jgi:predicted DNA-binding transcriptional regulator AlpA
VLSITILSRDPDVILREREAAAVLKLSVRTLQSWRTVDTGPSYVRLGGRAIGYRAGALRAWLLGRESRTAHDRTENQRL